MLLFQINTHQDDANGLAFADTSGHLLFTTGDDGLCKAWDKRTLNTDHPNPVGIFSGHKDGITHVDSRVRNVIYAKNCSICSVNDFCKSHIAIQSTVMEIERFIMIDLYNYYRMMDVISSPIPKTNPLNCGTFVNSPMPQE